jgi:hypothetical protein
MDPLLGTFRRLLERFEFGQKNWKSVIAYTVRQESPGIIRRM